MPPVPDLNSALLLNGAILVAANFLLGQLRAMPTKAWSLILRRFSVTVEIPESGIGFQMARAFIADQRFIFRVRNMSLLRKTDPNGTSRWELPPSPGSHHFWFEGRPACLDRSRRDLNGGGYMAIFETLTIRFFLGDAGTIRRFMDAAEAHESAPPQDTLQIQTWRLDSWDCPVDRPRRPLSTVYLPDGVGDDMAAAIGKFLDSRDWYREHGIPYRMGVLLEGPPGNGKTSAIKALASHFGKTLRILPLGDKMHDESLVSAFSSVQDSFVVAEDIDCLCHFEGRAKAVGAKLTFSGLLNAIDGVASSEGYVLFFTTNHAGQLDPALLRPGRIDHVFHIGNVETDQARSYFSSFYGAGHDDLAEAFATSLPPSSASMAEVQNHLMKFRDRPELAASTPVEVRHQESPTVRLSEPEILRIVEGGR